MYKTTLTLIAAAMLAACTQTSTPDTNQPPQNIIACSEDAKQCSDGSWVGRSGPNCEFACPPAPPN